MCELNIVKFLEGLKMVDVETAFAIDERENDIPLREITKQHEDNEENDQNETPQNPETTENEDNLSETKSTKSKQDETLNRRK